MKKLLLLWLGIVGLAATATAQSTATLDFGSNSGFSSWNSSYTGRTLDFTEATVVFSSANKQSGTITDCPVMKNGDITVTMKEGYTPITKITLTVKQWTTKKQTVAVTGYSLDGTNFTAVTDGPSVTTGSGTEVVYDNVPDGTVAVKFSATGGNQIGIASAVVEYGTVAPGGVAKPKASVEAGTYANPFELELTCATADAEIFYSLVAESSQAGDLTNAVKYTAPIAINEPCYIEAYAQNGDTKSETIELTYDFKVAAPVISPNSGIYPVIPEITITSATTAAVIRYTTDGTEPTADSQVYTAAFKPEGDNVTVKAQAFVENWTASDVTTASYEIGEEKGTLENPLTASEAAELALAGSTDKVYVKGIVSKVISTDANITSYKNLDYYISDDGTTTATQFEVFRGKYFDGADFTTDNKLKAGDEVVVLGALTTYNNTPELAAGSTLILLNGSDKPEDPENPDDPINPDDPQGTTVVFDFKTNDYGMTLLSGTTSAYNDDPTVIEVDGVTLTLAGKTRLWKASSANELRFYSGSSMTFSVVAPKKITKIQLDQNGSSFSLASTEAASSPALVAPVYENGVWSGEATEVKLEANFASSNKAVHTLTVIVNDTQDIEGLGIDEENAPAVYYNLQGMQVANPTTGIYVRVQGSKVTKVLVK